MVELCGIRSRVLQLTTALRSGLFLLLTVTTVKVKVIATDQAGNIASAISSSPFTVDSSAPVIAATIINDGAAYAGTALLNIKTNVLDNYSSAAQISVRLSNANSGTGDCQSEYNNDNWTSYTNSTTNIGFTITPVDGTKKLCIWSKDSVGNISVFSPTTGTAGVDTDSIDFQIGHPPEFISFLASRTGDSATIGVLSGQGMTISYSLTDVEGLDNNPISIAYTTNNTTWKDIITDQDISNQAKCNLAWWFCGKSNPQFCYNHDMECTFLWLLPIKGDGERHVWEH
jgi:hypothetical protein